jgi:hypothetical protein
LTKLYDLFKIGIMKLRVDQEWLRQKYLDEGLSCQKIVDLLGQNISRQTVYKRLMKVGIKPRSRKDSIFYVDGERCIVSQGYFWIWKPGHARANGGYVKRAVLNLEKKLGRYLKDGEFPHHIDGNRMNDNPENLEPTDRSNHMKIYKPIGKRGQK